MDTEMQNRVDTLVEDEISRGFRVKSLPKSVQAVLKETHEMDASCPLFEHIRFVKPTPRKRRLINEAVIGRYHVDLKNPNLLSNEQLKKLNIERGEWSDAMQKRMDELTEETNRRMRDLYSEGFDQREAWATEITELSDEYLKEINDKTSEGMRTGLNDAEIIEAKLRFQRWQAWSPELQAEYDAKYAAEQSLEKYSPDRDQQWLLDHTPSPAAAEAIQALDDLRDKLRRFVELINLRQELIDLQIRHARIFSESVEQRREAAEQLARIYYCSEIVDVGGISKGPLAKTIDGMWDLPQEVIDWLVVESYFFYNNVPDEARDFLEQWGFVQTPRLSGTPAPSAALPEDQSSKPVSEPVVAMAEDSSALVVPTSSTTRS